MAEQSCPHDDPLTRNIFRAPSEEPPNEHSHAGASHQQTDQEYIYQLQSELQESRARVLELEQRPPQPPQTTVAQGTGSQYVAPGIPTSQFGPTPWGNMPQQQQAQFPFQQQYYPYQTQMMYPNQFGMFPQPQYETRKKCSFKHFMDCRPPTFSGSSDPTVTLNWLREVDRALDACQCEPEFRVLYASRLFKDRAMVWWDSITGHMTKEQISAASWEQFYNKVCEQYCTSYDVDRMKKEFMELRMTNEMTVDEAIEQFNDKLRFVHQWVPDERSKIQQFVGMILPEYRTMARAASTLSQAFVMAKTAESDVKEERRMKMETMGSQMQSHTTGQSSAKPKNTLWGKVKGHFSKGESESGSRVEQRVWCQQCRTMHSGPCSIQTKRCIRCGIVGHVVQACSFRNEVCWNCLKEGHRSAHCP